MNTLWIDIIYHTNYHSAQYKTLNTVLILPCPKYEIELLSSSFWQCWCLCACSSKGRLVRMVWNTMGTGLHRNSLHTGLHVDTASLSLPVLSYPIPIPPQVHQYHLQYWIDVSIVHSIGFNLEMSSPHSLTNLDVQMVAELFHIRNLALLTCLDIKVCQTETFNLADKNSTELNNKTVICCQFGKKTLQMPFIFLFTCLNKTLIHKVHNTGAMHPGSPLTECWL